MQERHIVVEGEPVIVKVALASDRGVWGVTNTSPVIVLWKRQRTAQKIDTFMRCCFSVISVCNVGPVSIHHWTKFRAHRGWLPGLMPLCTTLSSIVKYLDKCTRRYYIFAGIEQLHYLKFEKKNILLYIYHVYVLSNFFVIWRYIPNTPSGLRFVVSIKLTCKIIK